MKQQTIDEIVNSPNHYKSAGICSNCNEPFEAIDITRHYNFNLGNALKYIIRSGKKDSNPIIQDLKKAIFYLNDEINRIS